MAKKIVLKKKGDGKKPVIRLNAPATEEAPPAPVEEPAAPTAPPEEKAPMPDPKATMVAEPPKKKDDVAAKPEAKAQAETIFKFYCVYCGQKLSANVAAAGKQIKCPACGRTITVPEPPSE